MLNFHKYGFLDAKRLIRYFENSNYWLCRYNPIWIFIWSDLYKPEIAFSNDFCYIRYYMPNVGICYYPPLGNGDLLQAIKIIKEDALENGFDFYVGPADESMVNKLEKCKLKLYENRDYDSYVYIIDDFGFPKKTKNKNFKKNCDAFLNNHPNLLIKRVKKEDFPTLLGFINDWNLSIKQDEKDNTFFSKLNMIKKCIDHLYEFDLIGIMLIEEDKIYGLGIGSIFGNSTYLHVNISINEQGANEALLSAYSKMLSTMVRYINLGEDFGIEEVRKTKCDYIPYKLEKFYSTFSI